MDVETVRIILERTFQMPVAESDAQIVLDRLGEIFQQESRPTQRAVDLGDSSALEGVSTPEVLSAGQADTTPAPNH